MAWIVSAVTALLVLCAAPATAQNYPAKPIHILVPYAPGGITDIAARIVGAKLTEAWGQQVVVENRPGGNGFIAMTAGAKAAADGYTLTMATVGDVAINPAMFKDMPYDVQRDFAPIAMVSDAPMVLATNANAPYKSVDEVIAAAKAQPGRLSVATPGNGSVNQIVLEWTALNTGTKFQHIPYKGGAPAAPPLAGGDIRSACWRALRPRRTSSPAAPRAGRDHGQASKLNPEWPTLQEAGVKEVDASNWTALFAPKGTPQAIVDKLNAEVVKILNMPDVKERFAGGGVETIPSSAAELDKRVLQEARASRSSSRRQQSGRIEASAVAVIARGGGRSQTRERPGKQGLSSMDDLALLDARFRGRDGRGLTDAHPLAQGFLGRPDLRRDRGRLHLLARQYRLGDMHRMGPAMFPTLVGALLAALGAVMVLRSFALDGRRSRAFRGPIGDFAAGHRPVRDRAAMARPGRRHRLARAGRRAMAARESARSRRSRSRR